MAANVDTIGDATATIANHRPIKASDFASTKPGFEAELRQHDVAQAMPFVGNIFNEFGLVGRWDEFGALTDTISPTLIADLQFLLPQRHAKLS